MTKQDNPTPLLTCERLLDELLEIRKTLQVSICQCQPGTETAHAYNATLFHLQSAREELKRTIQSLQPQGTKQTTKQS